MKQMFHHLEIEIPQQEFKVAGIGIVSFNFDRVKCRDFQVSNDTINGLYLSSGHIGLSLKFNVFCFTNAKQTDHGQIKVGLLGSAINLNLNGSFIKTELGFKYDQSNRQIIPVIETLNVSFEKVDVRFKGTYRRSN